MDYVMKIMASWMIFYELEGTKTRRDYIDSSGTKQTNQFTYQQPFQLHFKYQHQVDDYNNKRHAPIFLERTWATKFYPDHNFPDISPCQKSIQILHQGNFKMVG